jgi:signal transduction histidine kinase
MDYFALNMYREALTYRNLEKAINDSLNNVELNKQLKQIQQNYAVEKKQQQIDLLVKENENSRLKQNITLFAALITGVLLLSGFFLYIRISRLKNILQQQNEEMHVKNNMLEELNETKNKLFSIVGHDLKGPFGAFKSMLGLIKTNRVPAEESRIFLQQLYDGFTDTFQLLDSLLLWANTQIGGISKNASVFNIWQTVNQSIRLLQIRADAKNIAIETNETLDALLVEADMYMADIAVRNLLENAVKFSNQGSTIKITAEKENGFIKVAISDTGKGINTASQAKLFNKTSFSTTPGTAGEKGNGLGLHITKELVEKNGGKIWFQSTTNKGSTFYFTIAASTNLANHAANSTL